MSKDSNRQERGKGENRWWLSDWIRVDRRDLLLTLGTIGIASIGSTTTSQAQNDDEVSEDQGISIISKGATVRTNPVITVKITNNSVDNQENPRLEYALDEQVEIEEQVDSESLQIDAPGIPMESVDDSTYRGEIPATVSRAGEIIPFTILTTDTDGWTDAYSDELTVSPFVGTTEDVIFIDYGGEIAEEATENKIEEIVRFTLEQAGEEILSRATKRSIREIGTQIGLRGAITNSIAAAAGKLVSPATFIIQQWQPAGGRPVDMGLYLIRETDQGLSLEKSKTVTSDDPVFLAFVGPDGVGASSETVGRILLAIESTDGEEISSLSIDEFERPTPNQTIVQIPKQPLNLHQDDIQPLMEGEQREYTVKIMRETPSNVKDTATLLLQGAEDDSEEPDDEPEEPEDEEDTDDGEDTDPEDDDGEEETTGELMVSIVGTNGPVSEGDTLEVTAEIENTGDTELTQTIRLFIGTEGGLDFVVMDDETVTVAGGDSQTISLGYEVGAGPDADLIARVIGEDDSDETTIATSDMESSSSEGEESSYLNVF